MHDKHTFGDMPSAEALCRILNAFNDEKYSRKVGRVFGEYTTCMKVLHNMQTTPDTPYHTAKRRLMKMLYHAFRDVTSEHNFPKDIETHLHCVMNAVYRKELRITNDKTSKKIN